MREKKGNNLLLFPDDYIVIDIETTGLSPEYDSIIEICALKYIDQKLDSKFSTLVNPGYNVSDFIVSLTGITNEMLVSAPSLENVISDFFNFIGNFILVGHNVNFDINFLYDMCEKHLSKPLSNDFIDTLRIARILYKKEQHNKLSDLSKRFNLPYDHAHRAEFDCLLTNDILGILHDQCEKCCIDIKKSISPSLCAKDIISDKVAFDETHPLFGKTIVFTGALEKMVRKDAMQIVADYGGINADSVTKSTNYLVLGNNTYCTSIKGGKSSKQKKAEKLKLSGQDIEIIPENVFYDMIDFSQYPSVKRSDKKLAPDEKSINSGDFNAFEISVFEHIKNLLVRSNRDISRLRCNLQGKTFCIMNFYEIAKFNLRGKKKYFTVHTSFDLSKYDMSFLTVEPSPASAPSRSSRFIINNIDDLNSLDSLFLALSDNAFETTKTYETNTTIACKNIKTYLRDNFC